MASAALPPSDLYERDYYTWIQEQVRALRERHVEDLDWPNLAEEIGNAAQRFAREVARGEFPGPEHAYSANGATPATSGERDEVRYGAG